MKRKKGVLLYGELGPLVVEQVVFDHCVVDYNVVDLGAVDYNVVDYSGQGHGLEAPVKEGHDLVEHGVVNPGRVDLCMVGHDVVIPFPRQMEEKKVCHDLLMIGLYLISFLEY